MSRDRVFSTSLLLAPLALLAGTALTPSSVGDRISGDRSKALAQLDAVAAARERLSVSALLLVLGLALLVPAAFALGSRAGWSRSALVGVVLVSVGAPAGAAVNAASLLLLRQLTDPSVQRGSAVEVRTAGSGQGPLFGLYVLAVVGLVVLAIALWKSGAGRWPALLIGVGTLAGFGAPEGPAGAALTLPLLVGAALAARPSVRLPELAVAD